MGVLPAVRLCLPRCLSTVYLHTHTHRQWSSEGRSLLDQDIDESVSRGTLATVLQVLTDIHSQ